MLLTYTHFFLLLIAFFVIAMVYASVGFGGGSSYLAILALVFSSFFLVRSTALICNLAVVSGSTYLYWKNGFLDFRKFLPFVASSIPMAFFGARFRLSENTFFMILGGALVISALALIYQTVIKRKRKVKPVNHSTYSSVLLGAGIGLLSGLVGIGGGIFLAPILNHMKWDSSVKIAALSSFFILVNSVSGITGLLTNGTFQLPLVEAIGLLIVVLIGGQIGIRLSLNKLTGKGIKLITAMLVLIVGVRILFDYGF